MQPEQLLDYVLHGSQASAETKASVSAKSGDDALRLLNLSHTWISSVLLHVMQKVNRVSFGLLSDQQIASSKHDTLARKLLCVPFVGKDTPSAASEFSHPGPGVPRAAPTGSAR